MPLNIYALKAVSYTHLDVYKRQAVGNAQHSAPDAANTGIMTESEHLPRPERSWIAATLLCIKNLEPHLFSNPLFFRYFSGVLINTALRNEAAYHRKRINLAALSNHRSWVQNTAAADLY